MFERVSITGDGSLVSGYSGRVLLTVSLGWAVVQTGQFLVPPLLPAIIDDLGITPFRAGFIVSVMSGSYALFQYPSGRFSDRLTRPTVFVPGLGLLAAGAALIGSAPAYLPVLAGAAVLGVGKALYGISARAYLSDLFGDRRGTALGLFSVGTDVGGILGSVVAVGVLAAATWQAPFLAICVVLLALLVALHRLADEGYVVERVDVRLVGTFRRLLTTRRLLVLLAVYGLYWFANHSLIAFVPTFLQVEKGFSEGLASSMFALLFVVGLVAKPVGGIASDRTRRALFGSLAVLVAVAALAGIILTESTLLVGAGLVVYAVGQKPFSPVMDALLMDVAPEGKVGGDLGAMRTVAQGTGSLGPATTGLLAQTYDYTVAFAVIAAAFLACAGMLLALSRR